MDHDEDDPKTPAVYGAIEELLAEPIDQIGSMYDRFENLDNVLRLIPEILAMSTSISTAQTLTAQALESIATTFKKTEERTERMESRHEALVALAMGKDQMPLKSHYYTLYATLLPTVIMAVIGVLGILYITKQDLKVQLNKLEVNQHKTQELIKSNTDEQRINAAEQREHR